MFKEVDMPYWKVTVLLQMYLAITVSAFMNVYWMWLIVMQIVRIIRRAVSGDTRDNSLLEEDDDKLSDDEGGATPSSARRHSSSDGEDDKVPLI